MVQWFTGTTITQLSPDSGNVEFDVHETACGTCLLAHGQPSSYPDVFLYIGTDPRDLNNSS